MADAPTTDAPEGETPEATDDNDIEGLKSALRKERDRAKAAEKEAKRVTDLEGRLKEYEDRDKTESERLTANLRDTSEKLTATEKRALRLEIAIDKGLPKSLALRLQGDTPEEMAADADELLATVGAAKKTPPDFDGGPREPAPGADGDMNAQIRARAGR